MSESGRAAAVGGDRLLVEVVHEGRAVGWEARELHAELDTNAIGRGDGRDGTAGHALLGGDGSDVAGDRCVGDLGSGDDSGGLSTDDRRRSEDGDD